MAGRLFSLFLISFGLTLVDLWAEGDQALEVSRGSVELLLLSEYETIGLDAVESDSGILLGLEVQIEPGWYFSWKSLDKENAEPSIVWNLPEGFKIMPLDHEKPKRYQFLGLESYGYPDSVVFLYRLYPSNDVVVGDQVDLSADVEWLLCSNVCQPGSERVSLSLEVDTEDVLSEASERLNREEQSIFKQTSTFEERILNMGFWGWILLAFLGGVLLNLMPCVLPVLSIKLLSLIEGAQEGRSRRIFSGFCYTAGSVFAFSVLAILLFVLRSLGESIGWGFQLQNPYFVVFLVALFFLVGLNLFGVFEVGTSLIGLGAQSGSKGSVGWSSFLMGVLVAIVGAPCIGPFLGAVSGLALQLDPFSGVLIFAVLGLGLAFPFLSIALIPSWIRFIPKPGGWMLTFRRIMGLFMFLSVAFLLWVIGQSAGLSWVFMLLSLLSGLFVFAWALGQWGSINQPRLIRGCVTVAALGAFILVVVLGGQSLSKRYSASQIQNDEVKSLEWWQPWSSEGVEQALAEGRPVFIDFTADWCLICQSNKVFVLNTKKTQALFDRHSILPLRADWTLKDEAIAQALESYGRSGVPVYVLLSPQGGIKILPQTLTYKVLKRNIESLLQPK